MGSAAVQVLAFAGLRLDYAPDRGAARPLHDRAAPERSLDRRNFRSAARTMRPHGTKLHRSATMAMLVAGCVLAGTSATSCGPQRGPRSYAWSGLDESNGQNVTVSQGPMPTDETFTGVYRSPQIGDLELVQTGSALTGRYEYDRGSCHVTATLEGTVEGNVAQLRWTENHRPCGRIAPVVGRAYFLYMLETTANVTRGRLFGRWGYNDDDREGGPWMAFKLPNRTPRMLEEAQDGTRAEPGASAAP